MKDYRKQNVCICFALSVLFYSFFCTYSNYNIKTIPQESLTENKTVIETEKTKQETKLENFIAKTNKENSQEIKNYILKYSQEYNLDYKLLAGIIFIESKFDPNAFSEGSNAKGLGQLTPITLKEIKNKTKQEIDPYDIEENIKGTAIYLSLLSKDFSNYNNIIQAYNIGPTAVKNAMKNNEKLDYNETNKYISLFQKIYTEI